MKKKHWKLVILSGILYFFCQICRTDLSACMVDLLPDLGIAKDAMGLAITAGYIAYAVGMSINSLLTDRTNPRLMICAAMFCCAATHLGIRLLPYLPVMIVLWCVNGYAQSAVWPSIVRLTADNLPAEQQESALRIVSLFQHAGSLSCFLIVPAELALGGWRMAMTVTAAACLTLGLVWALMRELCTAPQTAQTQKNQAAKLNWQFFRRGRLFYFMGVACLTGMIRDGLTSWAPVYFSEEFSLNATLSLILSAVLPAAKILALAVHPAVQKKVPKTRMQLIVFYAGCAAAACIVLLANLAGWTLAAAGFMAVMLLPDGLHGPFLYDLDPHSVRLRRPQRDRQRHSRLHAVSGRGNLILSVCTACTVGRLDGDHCQLDRDPAHCDRHSAEQEES